MAKLGKISTIKKEYGDSGIETMQTGLAKKGMTRVPGTGVFKYPYKELNGMYRTGLDEKAVYIQRIADPTAKKIEIKRVKALRTKLEEALGGIDLGPRAPFWNYALSKSENDQLHVQPVKLIDGDNYFDFESTHQELAFAWLRVHPTIASSYQAWKRGEFPADTQFYVVDDSLENTIIFKKKQTINRAIAKFDGMAPAKQKKIARLLGLPVNAETPDEFVYNKVDNILKQSDFSSGKFQGLSTVEVFMRFADMKDDLLHIKDLVKQAIEHSIYRARPSGAIYEGEYEVAKNEEELVKHLIDEEHQDDLLTLEGKLKIKKIAAV